MCDECEWEESLENANRLLEATDRLPDKCLGFRDGVQERLESMRYWIETNEHVTEPMKDAMDNIEAGMRKWGAF